MVQKGAFRSLAWVAKRTFRLGYNALVLRRTGAPASVRLPTAADYTDFATSISVAPF